MRVARERDETDQHEQRAAAPEPEEHRNGAGDPDRAERDPPLVGVR